jgi:hypothetical protein
MPERKLRSDAGRKRKPDLTIREQAVRWYATLDADGRQRFLDDLQLIAFCMAEVRKPEGATS